MVIEGGPIGRIPAQQLAREELAKGMYGHESFSQWVYNELNRLYRSLTGAVPGGWWATVSMVAIAVVIIVVVLARIGPVGRSRRHATPTPVGGAGPMTAREHRDRARQYAADADYSNATVEAVRAIAASLEERGVLVPGPARTADELAHEAGVRFPGQAADLAAAALLFDDVCYGERPGTPGGFARVQQLDDTLTKAELKAKL
jgi:Domain of unknown function (DUF4129)